MLEKILKLVNEKNIIDQKGTWSNGSITYFDSLSSETAEVKAELRENNIPYLEDELGDIVWTFLNLVKCLENEGKVDNLESILKRVENKYSERIEGIKNGKLRKEIKIIQKERLKKEFEEKYGDL